MKNCQRCGGKGYLEEFSRRNGGLWNILMQCCDIAAYTRAVQERKAVVEADHAAQTIPSSNVLPFPYRPRTVDQTLPVQPGRGATIIPFPIRSRSVG